MEFTQLIRERYSCKKYDGRRVDPAQLEAILQAGRLARPPKTSRSKRSMSSSRTKAWRRWTASRPAVTARPPCCLWRMTAPTFTSTRAGSAIPA